MTRSELVTVITLALLVAVLLGWTLRWAFGSILRTRGGNVETVDDMAARLNAAEEAQATLAAQLAATDQSLRSQLRGKEAELEAAMDGLRQARQHSAEWQAAYETLKSGEAR